MPLDNRMYVDHGDDIFYRRAVWYKKFVWFPRRCVLSDELIWLTFAYKGTAMFTGPGDPIFERKWISKEHFLFARLAGKL